MANMSQTEAVAIATNVVSRILDVGLAKSSWRDHHEEAYIELLRYRGDLVDDVTKVILHSFANKAETGR